MSSSLSSLADNLAVDKMNFNEESKTSFDMSVKIVIIILIICDLKIIICYLNVFNVIQGTKNSLNMILLIDLEIHMNFVIKILVNLY